MATLTNLIVKKFLEDKEGKQW